MNNALRQRRDNVGIAVSVFFAPALSIEFWSPQLIEPLHSRFSKLRQRDRPLGVDSKPPRISNEFCDSVFTGRQVSCSNQRLQLPDSQNPASRRPGKGRTRRHLLNQSGLEPKAAAAWPCRAWGIGCLARLVTQLRGRIQRCQDCAAVAGGLVSGSLAGNGTISACWAFFSNEASDGSTTLAFFA